MLDIFAAGQVYSRRQIENIGRIRREVNQPDDQPKTNGKGLLTPAIKTNRLTPDVQDYIFRGPEKRVR